MAARDHPLLGKWRIIGMALWDSDFLDLVEPAYIRFDAAGAWRVRLRRGLRQPPLPLRPGRRPLHLARLRRDGSRLRRRRRRARRGRAPHGRDPLPRRRRLHLQGAPMVTRWSLTQPPREGSSSLPRANRHPWWRPDDDRSTSMRPRSSGYGPWMSLVRPWTGGPATRSTGGHHR